MADGGAPVIPLWRDPCVLCGEPTPYSRSLPVECRVGYVEGAGQLCPACWSEMALRGGAAELPAGSGGLASRPVARKRRRVLRPVR